VGASRVVSDPLCLHAVATTPAGSRDEIARCSSLVVGLPQISSGSAPALSFSRLAQRLLALRPADSPSRLCDPLHRRPRRLCHLHRRSDCYRVERSSSRAGLSLPLWINTFSRRTEKSRLHSKSPQNV